MAGLLKRKFDQLDEDSSSFCSSSSSSSSLCSSGSHSRSCSPTSLVPLAWDSDQEDPWDFQVPLPVHDICGPQSFTPPSILKRTSCKRPGRVTFDGITVFYFSRCQGFTSVPSRGGCTLGMAPRHSACHHFSMAEFTQEQARARQEKLRLRLKEEKLETLRWQQQADAKVPLTAEAIDDASVEDDLAVAMAGGRLEEMTCLQPYPARKRRALLRAAGVQWIDREEKQELQALRQSREDCGCRCDMICDPETCSCSLAGIKCQMDHTAFPCGCCKEGCENPEGRVEFNQARVQTHFIHTLTRLQLEQGAESLQEQEAVMQAAPASPGEQALASTFSLAKPPVSSELGDSSSSCSSDTTASSSESGSSEVHGGPTHPALPGPGSGLQPSMDDDSLARILSFSDSDLGREEDEEDEDRAGVGNLDNLSCFHPADFFGTADPMGLSTWAHSSSDLPAGLLDENANLDASCFLDGSLECLGESGLPTTPLELSGSATGHGSSVDLSLSSCDSFELLQTLPDYSLGPHCTVQKGVHSPEHLEIPFFPSPAFSPPGDASTCFLESILGLSEPPADTLSPLVTNPLLEEPALASLLEPMPV